MGAWGSGTFENDAASDFLLEYEAAGAKAVADALAAVQESWASGHVDGDVGASGVAAAEIAAASLGQPALGLEPETLAAVLKHREAVRALPGVAGLALSAVDRIGGSAGTSELHHLWAEAGEGEEFLSVLADLRARLEAAGR